MSNNKQTMKLYTEEQVREALWKTEHPFSDGKNVDEIMNSLIPIQLPSDEDIETEIWKNIEGQWICFPDIFRSGAIWMRNKIQGGNK